jgi:hypothetical protein
MRLVNYNLQHGDLPAAREAIEFLENSDIPASRDFAASRRFRLELDERAAAMGIKNARRTPVWWMEGPYPGNFGDILNPYLIEKITGIPPLFSHRGRGLLAIGSIIKFAQAGTRVWGSGTPRMTDQLAADADYRAVRGPLTRQLVLESGGTCPEIYGDPALLLPRYYRPSSTGPSHKLGLIPHISHLAADLPISEGVRFISPKLVGYDAIESFIDAIVDCESILTSSLHGLIVAHAYGVPARWCEYGDKGVALAGDGTKFQDYFLSVGLPVQEPLDLSQFAVIDESLVKYVDQNVDLTFDGDALLAAFPEENGYKRPAPAATQKVVVAPPKLDPDVVVGGDFVRVADEREIGEADLTLTETPRWLSITGVAGAQYRFIFRTRVTPGEEPSAAAILFDIPGDSKEIRTEYGVLGQALGRHRFLPHGLQGGIVKLRIMVPASGTMRVGFRAWKNRHPVTLSSTYAVVAG